MTLFLIVTLAPPQNAIGKADIVGPVCETVIIWDLTAKCRHSTLATTGGLIGWCVWRSDGVHL